MSSYVVVMVAVANREEAVKIARGLLEERLIACANIIGPVSSIFWWEGNVEEAREFLVFMKSHENHFERLSESVRKIHSYEVPEIIALPIIKGSKSYLEWLGNSLQPVSNYGEKTS
jgi:periplasmic divalent cation tolerance protein